MITQNISMYIFEFMFNLYISLYLSRIPNSSNGGDILSSRKSNNEKKFQLDTNIKEIYLFKCVLYTWLKNKNIVLCNFI